MKMSSFHFAIAAVVLVAPQPALAWDGIQYGRVGYMEITAGNNFGVRVFIEGVNEVCGPGSPNWAYLNESTSNYQAYLSAIIAARASGSPIRVWTNRVGSYCEIGYMGW